MATASPASSPRLALPIRAAAETLQSHGIRPDRCDILQDGHTLVVRLTESLVARIVTDRDGPRQGTDWFVRENAIARHLTRHGAPIIPLHPALPPEPYQHLGFAMNFWEFVTATGQSPDPAEAGRTLCECHAILRTFPEPLPELAILSESLSLLPGLLSRGDFPEETVTLLRHHLTNSLTVLAAFPCQPLHGDAHMGNLMQTTRGLLWTDWEDAFAGPVEWDAASLIWNARLIDHSPDADTILSAYQSAGGSLSPRALDQSLIARAAVMSAWYPILYPNPGPERLQKLQHRLHWLAAQL